MSITCIFNAEQIDVMTAINWKGLTLIAIAFAIPFADTLSVVINRLGRGQSPMVGGKDHTTHHLVYKGWKDRDVWFIFLTLSIIGSVLTILYMVYSHRFVKLMWVLAWIFPIAVFLRLFFITRKYPEVSR